MGSFHESQLMPQDSVESFLTIARSHPSPPPPGPLCSFFFKACEEPTHFFFFFDKLRRRWGELNSAKSPRVPCNNLLVLIRFLPGKIPPPVAPRRRIANRGYRCQCGLSLERTANRAVRYRLLPASPTCHLCNTGPLAVPTGV